MICKKRAIWLTVAEALMLLFRFVNAKEMAYRALRAVQEGELKIDPPEFEKTWYDWLHDVRWACGTSEFHFNVVVSPIALPSFHIFQGLHLTFNFDYPKWIISLLSFLHLRFSSVLCSNPLLPIEHVYRGFTYLNFATFSKDLYYSLQVRFPMRSWFFQLIKSFQLHYGPGVDSASNRNEYQESSWA
jgi:hypothetical protein